MDRTMVVLGGTGFIGREVVATAVAAGWRVVSFTRSAAGMTHLQQAGATPVMADLQQPQTWVDTVRNAQMIVDLVQPPLPTRLSLRALQRVSQERQAVTRYILQGLAQLPVSERPLLMAISGVDDLHRSSHRVITEQSPLRTRPQGFGVIGIPVRHLIAASGIAATYLYFGTMVYGPGKAFADRFVTAQIKGNGVIVGAGTNQLPVTYVTDAARAVVHLAGLPADSLTGQTYVAADGSGVTQAELYQFTAQLLGVKGPRRVPAWLANLVGGDQVSHIMGVDARVAPTKLLASGFTLHFPTYREGIPDALRRMALMRDTPPEA